MKSVLKKRVERMSPDEIVHKMYLDPLTGVWNRCAFNELLEDKLGNNPRLKVAIVDLDSLKWLNDNLGHRAGDEALKEVADLLSMLFTGRCFRLAGDEFLVYAATREELSKKLTAGARIYSYGIGDTLIEADDGLKADKARRLETGFRAERGRPPQWNSERFIVDG